MNTKKPFVITISREVGSGGHTIGKILAQELGVRYCDKLLIESLEKQFGLTKSGIEKLKGQKKNWLADILTKVDPVPSAKALGLDPKYTQEFKVNVTTDDIYKAEVEILTEFANMGSCVIAGRSGFFVLKDHPNILNVFITASMEYRIQRVMKKQNLNEESALAVINGIDEARENYTKRYAGVSRYDTRNYHLALSADNHTEEEIAKLILDYIR